MIISYTTTSNGGTIEPISGEYSVKRLSGDNIDNIISLSEVSKRDNTFMKGSSMMPGLTIYGSFVSSGVNAV